MAALGLLISVFGLGLLIFVHECGHFFIGKALKLKITEFFIGLPVGRSLIGFTRGETVYGIKPVLFGGYVKFAEFLGLYHTEIATVKRGSPAEAAGLKKDDQIIRIDGAEMADWLQIYNLLKESAGQTIKLVVLRRGQEVECQAQLQDRDGGGWLGAGPASTDDITIEELPRTMDGQRAWRKGLVIAAGPVMNIMLAVILFAGAMMIGFQEPSVIIDKTMRGGPAEQVGLKAGDKILSIDGKTMPEWANVTLFIKNHAGERVTIQVERGGQRLIFQPVLREKSTQGLLGIMSKLVRRPRGPVESVKEAFIFAYEAGRLILNFMAKLVTEPKTVVGQLRSPIGVVSETAPIAQRDIMQYIVTLAGISVAIGIFNFLPLPPLDGGRIFLSGVEFLIRRPLAKESLAFVNVVGVSLLLVLMTYVIAADIFRLAAPGG